MSENHFVQLAAINVNEHTERKGNLTYLSWAWAVDQLLRVDPTANWSYGQPTVMSDGTMLVQCTVTAFGIARSMQLPVMDHRNKAIAHPDAFAVNTAMQRCLVKAIALHGLGLYIYAGEDLPAGEEGESEEKPKRPNTATQVAVDALHGMPPERQDELRKHATEIVRLHSVRGDALTYVDRQAFDTEAQLALWALLPSNVRSWIKDAKKIAAMNQAASEMAKKAQAAELPGKYQ